MSKQSGPFWYAECDVIGAHTQGVGFEDAISMLEGLVNLMVRDEGHPEFEARVTSTHLRGDGSYDVCIESNAPALLAARVLKYQREVHRLSLADVAKRLGVSSRSSYANYEQGRTDPSLAKFRDLLAAVAPELALVIRPRPSVKARRRRGSAERRAPGSVRRRVSAGSRARASSHNGP